jgi:hypothetical protein
MAGPALLRSWWEVLFLIVFVFIVGMSEVSPFWKQWGGPIIIATFVFVVIAISWDDARH